jgi:hypothetical protein
MEEGQDRAPVQAPASEKAHSLNEAMGKFHFGDLRRKIKELPLKDETKTRVEKAVGEYLREFGPQEVKDALVKEWAKKVVLTRGELTAEEVVDLRKALGALQNSVLALADGRPDKFNEKIADRLIDRFKERAGEARAAGEEETAESLLSAAEENRDLKGILLKGTSAGVS